MVDHIFDDVKELMEREKGDQKVLEQIKRAAENNEVISVYEREYVRKLADRYLEKKIPETKPNIPDVNLPQTNSQTHKVTQTPPATQVYKQTRVSRKKPTKSILVIGGAILAIIIIVGVGVSGIVELPDSPNVPSAPSNENVQPATALSLDTDQSSYSQGDIISISGASNPSFGQTIALSIENAAGQVIWEEEVRIKSDGSYSTLTIAGGPGWQNAGTYSLNAEHGNDDVRITFSYLS